MQLMLALLLAAHAPAFDMSRCNDLRHELKIDCMSGGCSGLLTTGTGSSIRVRDPKECENECEAMSYMSTQNDEVCLAPIPPAKPDKLKADQASHENNHANNSASQQTAQKSAVSKAAEAEDAVKAKQAKAAEASEYGQKLQEKKLQSSDELLRRWDQELRSGKSQSFPPERAKWKNDQALVQEAERAREKNQDFPAEKANQAELPAIRGNLNQFSRARQLESDSAKNLGALALTLTKLMQMKSKAQANVTALDQSAASPAFLSSASSAGARKTQGAVSSALKINSIAGSALTHDQEKSSAAEAATSPEAASAKATGAGGPESTRAGLRARLRELLRKKMAADGMSDMPEEFLGELGIPLESTPGEVDSDQAAASAAEEEEIFRLAGAETEAEVRRLRAELQEEIARSEGVLPSDSLSLFERIKAAHDSCAAKKCVWLDHIVAAAPSPARL
jgi:hypothetical protein